MNEKKESRQSYERRLSNGRDEANTHLLFAVVGHYINFLASDHPKMAADKYLFMKSFLVIIIKALFQADSNLDFHLTKCLIARLEAESGLVKDYFARYNKKQGRILNSNPVILSAWSLPLPALKSIDKGKKNYLICKILRNGIAVVSIVRNCIFCDR